MSLSQKQTIETARLVAQGYQAFLSVHDLSEEIRANSHLATIRDLIRQTFFDLGIEVEFSGKGLHEKGVVIDIDEDKMRALNLNPDTLRFGQTVVKVPNQ